MIPTNNCHVRRDVIVMVAKATLELMVLKCLDHIQCFIQMNFVRGSLRASGVLIAKLQSILAVYLDLTYVLSCLHVYFLFAARDFCVRARAFVSIGTVCAKNKSRWI
jgi:hypothetical protein